MELTEEMSKAFQLIENTTECLYITGKAGTGKTTFLKYIVQNTHKKIVVAASTGIAAINAGGVTLHSLFNIPLSIQNPNDTLRGQIHEDKVRLFALLDTLIIDEISMVRPDIIDYIDRKLRFYRMIDLPFGGVQVIMFGDLYQLPPVVKSDEKNVLLQMYRGVYFFYAHIWRECGFRMVELTHVFRQSDSRFVEILNHIRLYQLTERDINDLDTIRDKREAQDYDNRHIHICTHRRDVQRINSEMLGEPTHVFAADFKDDFPAGAAPCPELLELRIGARVMTLVNDPMHLFCNGSMGQVVNIDNEHITVDLDSGIRVVISKFKWVAHEYKIVDNKLEVVDKGSCTQFPLALAWAITIHKSQGLTFDKITIHAKYVFAPGQLYVALSRCTSLEGIVSDSFISRRHIIPDNELLAFEHAMKACNNIFNRNTYRSLRLR